VDVHALDQQVQEKKAREAAEAEDTLRYADLANYFDNQVCHLVQQKRLKEQEIAKGYHNFHVEQQKKHATREWDLNDPEKLKTEVPPRMGDTPLGPSSLQVFDGEDPRAGARQALQISSRRSGTRRSATRSGPPGSWRSSTRRSWRSHWRTRSA